MHRNRNPLLLTYQQWLVFVVLVGLTLGLRAYAAQESPALDDLPGLPALTLDSIQDGPVWEQISAEEQQQIIGEALGELWKYISDFEGNRLQLQEVQAENGQIAYVGNDGQLYLMNPNGSDQHKIADTLVDVRWPAWSHDSQYLAFAANGPNGHCLYKYHLIGQTSTALACSLAGTAFHEWSPQSSRIVFLGWEEGEAARVWAINADGSQLKQLGPGLNRHNVNPTWLDEDTVIFPGEISPDVWRLHRVDFHQPNNQQAITPEFTCHSSCNCGSDQGWLAFPHAVNGQIAFVGGRVEPNKLDPGCTAFYAVYLADPEGINSPSKIADVAESGSVTIGARSLRWAPDNRNIAVQAGTIDTIQLKVVSPVDGSVRILHNREGDNWSGLDWAPDATSIAIGYQVADNEWVVDAVNQESNAVTTLSHGREPVWSGKSKCSAADKNQTPILLVPGWDGSLNQSLSKNNQLRYFINHLSIHGYVEGCNLFFATNTSPHLYLRENAQVIRNNLCIYYPLIKEFNPEWSGKFDIIAHSYGGLRARAFLESDELYSPSGITCGSPQNKVSINNLFTMGTPHGGALGDLPFAAWIGLNALWNLETPALIEMLPPVRLWQNATSRQPENVCYRLLAGDAREQWLVVLALMGLRSYGQYVLSTPNDLAVHEASAHALLLNFWRYPRTTYIFTPDLHGQIPEQVDPLQLLRSFVNPNSTFEEKIWPLIGQTHCSPLAKEAADSFQQHALPSVIEMVEHQSQPQQAVAVPLMDIQAGEIANSDMIIGQFDLNSPGESQISLHWLENNLELALSDPLGNPVNSETVGDDPNTDYFSVDTGFGLMASYRITDTITGTWTYTVTADSLTVPVGYRLLAIPSTPIAITGAAPAWSPYNSAVTITATVSYSGATPVIGSNVIAQIRRPDSAFDTITLFDDGNHHDGAANDGVFGALYNQTSLGGIYGIGFTATGTFNEEDYKRTTTAFFAIAPNDASLNGEYSDRGVDSNNDKLYEWLEVSVGLSVTEASTYTLSAELYAGDTFIIQARTQVTLTPGMQTVKLLFDGDAIRQEKLNGPYTVRNVLLLDESEVTLLIEAADNVHTTAPYSYLQFGHPDNIFLPIVMRQ